MPSPFSPSLLRSSRHFSTSCRIAKSNESALRALVYSSYGDPSKVLQAASFKPLGPPKANHVTLKIRLAPVNPADINTVEGVYPSRPSIRTDLQALSGSLPEEGVYIGGNEGVAEVVETGSAVRSLKPGDRVIFATSQSGTWASHQNAREEDLIKVGQAVSDVHAATLKINPPTALGMLTSFVPLSAGDWVIQNGANSAVGQAAIQIANSMGLKTINLVRDRPNIDELKENLLSLGATHVLTYSELADKSMKRTVKEWTQGAAIRLGLNCVGGKETSIMASYLGQDAHLVSYGAMSKSPLSLPTPLFIFRNLTSHGYWQSRWYDQHSREEREKMLRKIMGLIEAGKLREPEHEIVSLNRSNAEATQTLQAALQNMSAGRHGKKLLLKWTDV